MNNFNLISDDDLDSMHIINESDSNHVNLNINFDFERKKLNFSAKVTTEEKIIILCKIIIDDLIDVDSKLFSFKLFIKFEHLIFLDQSFSVRFLVDIDIFNYTFVHFNLIDQICDHLNLESILLSKSKRLRDYNNVISFTVTHVIYFNI